MPVSPLPGCYNQASWPGVGDVDECWVIAPYWALVVSRACLKSQLPTIAGYRSAAGVPDKPGPTGGNNLQSLAASKHYFPKCGAYSLVARADRFFAALGKGEVASLSVKSSELPVALRFGFMGNHQIAVVKSGEKLLVMNPLNKANAPLQTISVADLTHAAASLYGDGLFHAVMYPDHVPSVDPDAAEIAALKHQVSVLKAANSTLVAQVAELSLVRAQLVAANKKISAIKAALA